MGFVVAFLSALGMLVGSIFGAVWALGAEAGFLAWAAVWLLVLALSGEEGNQP